MVIALPKDSNERRRALDWLTAERIRHLRLFQAVQIDANEDGERFKKWLTEDDQSGRMRG
jgi:hypothetical protein